MMRAVPPLVLLAGVAALAGCVAGPPPVIETPAPVLPEEFLYAPEEGVAGSLSALMPQSDPAYAALSAQMLAQSPTLGEALARIDAARAGAAGAAATRAPLINGNGTVQGQRTNPAQFGTGLPPGINFDSERISYGANISASWDADLFGRLRARERSAIALIEASNADTAAIRIALLSELAASVIDWRTLQAREAALRSDLDAATSLARLAGSRERAGLAPGFDRLRAESAASSTRTRLAALESERARLVGRLVTLTAQSGAQVLGALQLGAGPAEISLAVPSTPSLLLTNRPDVLAAGARLAASDSALYATAAARFPQFSLSGALGLLAFNPGDIFDSDSIIGSLAASIAAPLLDFGRVEAQIDSAAADKRAAFQSYRGAVFSALGEAEGAYGLIAAADAEALAAREEQAIADRSAQLADTRYRAGLSDFLTVLEARRVADASGDRLAASIGRARRARVVLWQALGGDGETAQPIIRSISQ